MTTVLICSYLEPELIDAIRAAMPQITLINRPDLIGHPRYVADHTSMPERTPEQEAEWRTLLGRADVLFDFDATHREDLPDIAPNVRWIQATSAGIGKFVERMRYAERTSWIMTTASGVHARPLAEFALFAMLYFAKDYPYLEREKRARHWERYTTESLAGRTLSIIGLGKIGRETAKLAKAFDMRVIGTRRDPSQTVAYVDALYAPGDLHPLLEKADYLVLSTPHTPETEGLINAEAIAMLPTRAVIINIARGAVIDQNAMTAALQDGRLRGAALDVFASEPPAQDDPLWTLPNVIISPHSASTVAAENERIVELFIENLRRFESSQPLLNVLDVGKQY